MISGIEMIESKFQIDFSRPRSALKCEANSFIFEKNVEGINKIEET
jgi:hypothetical protein